MDSLFRRFSGAHAAALLAVGGGAVAVARAQSSFSPIPLEEGAGLLFFAALLPLLIFIFQALRSR